MESDFSNQNIVSDSAPDRMVLSQFGYDGSDEGFGAGPARILGAISRGPLKLNAARLKRQPSQKILKALKHQSLARQALKKRGILSGFKAFGEEAHPMEGLFDNIKKSVSSGFNRLTSGVTSSVKQTASQELSKAASSIASDPRVQQAAADQAKKAAADALAAKIVQTTDQATVLAKDIGAAVQKSKIPLGVLLGAAAAAYFLFLRKR